MIISILGIIILQGYWIFSAWNDKEKEFTLAVQQSLIRVADQIKERELNNDKRRKMRRNVRVGGSVRQRAAKLRTCHRA